MDSYFNGKDMSLCYPLDLSGLSKIAIRVYSILRGIPPGKTISYGELARKASTFPRAVGSMMRANRHLLFIPCHRVVRSDGKLGGFSAGVDLKKWLLDHEVSKMVFSA
ncbi:MAG: methylated-DNA--[protein]-cysteine S-methyltransferase [Synergistetes bacterium]|nr:methylated-DNA--[protein]-cysteine S-methyltransferase [Synergistota bacterium]